LFTIKIQLADFNALSGLEAVDFCRKYGLPVNVSVEQLWTTDRRNKEQVAKVDEAFARLYFNRNSVLMVEEVPVTMLVPGDLVLAAEKSSAVMFDDLSPERIKELWLAARFQRLIQDARNGQD